MLFVWNSLNLRSAPVVFMALAWAQVVSFFSRLSSLQSHTKAVLSEGVLGGFASRGDYQEDFFFTLIFPAEMPIFLGQRAAKQKQQRSMEPCDSRF